MTPESACPSANLLLELASGSLDPERATGLHEHIDRCGSCLQAVAELLRTEKPEGERLYPARYRLIEENARGGQARVLRCVDTVTRRQVALKELLESHDDSPGARRREEKARVRFVREARLTAMLTHPGIVPVYDIGQRSDGHPFYTMQFLHGRTLSQALRACRTTPERLRYLGHFRELAQAVSFAHSRGVVHRDIKPQNVVLGEYGQTMLVDWGLAKLTRTAAVDPELAADDLYDDDAPAPVQPDATVAGSVIGTPAYMSPEQAAGRLEDIDERSDVFGLGAVLYEILTGRPPLSGGNVTALLAAARAGRPAPVAELCPEAPAELAVIAEKAVALDRADRYEHAADMAADVEAYLAGDRVTAYEYSSWELLRRLVMRRKRTAIAALVGLAALVAALALLSVALSRADRERRRAELNGAEALVEGAQAAVGANELLAARARLRTALETADSPAARSLWRQVSANPLLWRMEIGGELNALAASPTERRLAVAGSLPGIRLVDLDTQAVRVLLGGTQVISLSYSSDGKVLAGGDDSGHAWLWDMSTFTARDLGGVGTDLETVRLDAGGRDLYAVSGDGRLWRFDTTAPAGTAPAQLPTSASLAYALAVAPSGGTLALVTDGGEARLFDVASGRETPLACPPGDAMKTAYSHDGAWLAASSNGVLCLWPAATAGSSPPRIIQGASTGSISFSPDGASIAIASYDGALRIWDRGRETLRQTFKEGENVFARQPAWIAGGGAVGVIFVDGTLKVFSTEPLPAGAGGPTAAAGWFARIAASPDGATLVTASSDGRLRYLDRDSGVERLAVKAHRGAAYFVSFSPDGQRVASAGADGLVRLWDASTGQAVRTLTGHTGVANRASFSGSGRTLVSVAADGARLWDPATGSLRAALPLPERSGPPDVAGEELSVGFRNGDVARFDLDTGKQLDRVPLADGPIQAVSYVDGGRALAVLTEAGALLLRDRDSGKVRALGTFECNPDSCTLVGDKARPRLALGQPGFQITIWDLASGARQMIRSRAWEALAFTPDGSQLAGCGGGGELELWDLASARPHWRGPLLRARAGEVFTHAGWTDLDGAPIAAPGAEAWRRVVAEEGRLADESADGGTLCVATFGGALEIWRAGARTARVELAGITRVVATPAGCVVLAGGAASAVGADGKVTTVAADANTVAAAGAEILAPSEAGLVVGDAAGVPRRHEDTGRGVTAVARTAGGDLVLGYEYGGLRLRRGDADSALRDTPPSTVVQIVDGPPDLVAASFADGTIGVWSAATGQRLLTAWLRGAATHLQLRENRLVALTETGQLGTWSLETLSMPYCELMRSVWSKVPVIWDGGVAVLRAPPKGHRCAR